MIRHTHYCIILLCILLSTKLSLADEPAQVCLDATREENPLKRIELFTTCIEKEYNSPLNMAIGYYGRGQAHYTTGDLDGALRDYDKSIELNPKYAESYVFRGILYNDLKHFKKAVQDFTSAIDLSGDNLYAYAHRAAAYANINEYSLAILDYDKVLELDPKFTKAYTFRAFAYLELELFEDAMADYNKVVELDPQAFGAYRNRGFAFERMEKFGQAIADYQKAVELNAQDAYSYNRLGFSFYRSGNLDEAIKNFNESITLDSSNAEPFTYRAVVYEAQKKYDQAVDSYTRALELAPEHSFTLNNFAWLLITAEDPRFRNPEKALELSQKAVMLTNMRNTAFLDTLAATYAELNQFGKAVETQALIFKLLEAKGPSKQAAEAMEVLTKYKNKEKHYSSSSQSNSTQ